ncbi:RAB44 protein, partial [Bucco capensis]|nr:RAB44 protein [Bucco capensis]
WEVLPADMSLWGVPARASSTGEDPFPELLKQEHFSEQSSLLREMNDAIAALSKQLKPQALAAPPDSVHQPWEDAEPQTAHSTTPMVLQETGPAHMDHKLLEGDLREEEAATAEHPAPDGTQADVWCLGAAGQAAPRELQEQGSAQAAKGRPHSASQQLDKKPPHGMETEQLSATPAGYPKEEMPPTSALQTRVQQKEDPGNDQPGMVLRDTSLGDAANSNLQLLGEQSNDPTDGQWKEKQEAGQKKSQEGKPSPGISGAVSADEAGAAPRSSPEASLGPDHLYNVLFVGDSHVGKTSFLHRLHADTFSPHLTATVGLDYQIKNLLVDNKSFALRLWDSAGQER